jgi:hypothetical protein
MKTYEQNINKAIAQMEEDLDFLQNQLRWAKVRKEPSEVARYGAMILRREARLRELRKLVLL